MNQKAIYGIIAVTVIAAIWGLYAAFAKTTTETDPTKITHGGAGDKIICFFYPPACVKST